MPETAIAMTGPGLRGINHYDFDHLQLAAEACFWNRTWVSALRDGAEPSAFVERPIMRIDERPGLFVTSVYNIVDSITFFTEEALRPRSLSKYAIPSKYFEIILSRPFEHSTVSMFRQAGFVTGEVTASGIWRTQEGDLDLGIPGGQIDALAWNRLNHHLIVADCKVLQLPKSDREIAAQWLRLGPTDSDGFKAKLRINAERCKAALEASGCEVSLIQRCLILDKALHLMLPDDDVIVTDIDLLRAALNL